MLAVLQRAARRCLRLLAVHLSLSLSARCRGEMTQRPTSFVMSRDTAAILSALNCDVSGLHGAEIKSDEVELLRHNVPSIFDAHLHHDRQQYQLVLDSPSGSSAAASPCVVPTASVTPVLLDSPTEPSGRSSVILAERRPGGGRWSDGASSSTSSAVDDDDDYVCSGRRRRRRQTSTAARRPMTGSARRRQQRQAGSPAAGISPRVVYRSSRPGNSGGERNVPLAECQCAWSWLTLV